MQLSLIPAAVQYLCYQWYKAYMHGDDQVQPCHVLWQPRPKPADDER